MAASARPTTKHLPMGYSVAFAAILSTGALAAAETTPPPLASLDRGFVCPETLPSDEARMAALRHFFDTYARLKPEASPPEIIAYRRLLLDKHHCRRTLDHLDAADRAVADGRDAKAQA